MKQSIRKTTSRPEEEMRMVRLLLLGVLLVGEIAAICAWGQGWNINRVGQLSEGAFDVAVVDSLAYVANPFGSSLQVIDIANPTSPRVISGYGFGYCISGLTVAGNYVYLTFWGYDEGGLIAMDVSHPLSPHQLGIFHTNYTYEAQVAGNYAYIAAYTSGLVIVDISNPNSLISVGSYNTIGAVYDIAVAGNYAYIVDDWIGLYIINITNPANPLVVGSCCIGGLTGVAVQGNYAYTAGGSLRIIDISNPAVPILLGICDIPVNDVRVAGEYAFAGGDANGLYVVKISNPYAPLVVGHYDTPGQAGKSAIDGNLVYLADYSYFGVYDCARAMTPPIELTMTPLNPPIQIPAGGGDFQFNITFENDNDYHIEFDAWIEIMYPDTQNILAFSRTNNSLPAGGIRTYTLMQTIPAAAPAGQYVCNAFIGSYPDTALNSAYFTFEKLTISEGVYVANWNCQEEVTKFENKSENSFITHHSSFIISANPNPFNSTVVLRFELSDARDVELVVYDIVGREVWRLASGIWHLGANEVVWNAEGMPSGIYFARLTANSQQLTADGSRSVVHKVLFLK
jgi:hypothetical protein